MRLTEDDTQTLEEQYRQGWFGQLTPEQQELAMLHQVDQFEAVPSYLEQQAKQFAEEA